MGCPQFVPQFVPIKKAKRLTIEMKVINPLDYFKENQIIIMIPSSIRKCNT